MEGNFLTVTEYALFYNVSRKTVYNYINNGTLRTKTLPDGLRLVDCSNYIEHPPCKPVGNPNFSDSHYQLKLSLRRTLKNN